MPALGTAPSASAQNTLIFHSQPRVRACATQAVRPCSSECDRSFLVSRRTSNVAIVGSLFLSAVPPCDASTGDNTVGVNQTAPTTSKSTFKASHHVLSNFQWRACSASTPSAAASTAGGAQRNPVNTVSSPDEAQCITDVKFTLYEPITPTTRICVAVILSPGFLVDPAAYQSYCEALAANSVPVLTYNKPMESALSPWDDLASAQLVRSLMDWYEAAEAKRLDKPGQGSQPAGGTSQHVAGVDGGRPSSSCTRFVLAGHSRGGKISVLAASADRADGKDRVRGLVLLDPADGSYDSVEGPGFPSSLPALTTLTAQSQNQAYALPVLTIGFGRNGDCIPARSNYRRFYKAAVAGGIDSPAALVVLTEVGHFQLLDRLTLLQQSACSTGKANVASVQRLCAALLLEWAKAVEAEEHGPVLQGGADVDADQSFAAHSFAALNVGNRPFLATTLNNLCANSGLKTQLQISPGLVL